MNSSGVLKSHHSVKPFETQGKASACKIFPLCLAHWAWEEGRAHAKFSSETLRVCCKLLACGVPCAGFARNSPTCSLCDLKVLRAEQALLIPALPFKGDARSSFRGRTTPFAPALRLFREKDPSRCPAGSECLALRRVPGAGCLTLSCSGFTFGCGGALSLQRPRAAGAGCVPPGHPLCPRSLSSRLHRVLLLTHQG